MGDREFSRAMRVGDQIQRELATLIANEVSDPRVVQVTLSGVEMTRDLRHAKVLVTPAAEADVESAIVALNRAAGFLRRRLGQTLRLRHLPNIRFEYDPTLDQAERLTALIDASISADTQANSVDEDG